MRSTRSPPTSHGRRRPSRCWRVTLSTVRWFPGSRSCAPAFGGRVPGVDTLSMIDRRTLRSPTSWAALRGLVMRSPLSAMERAFDTSVWMSRAARRQPPPHADCQGRVRGRLPCRVPRPGRRPVRCRGLEGQPQNSQGVTSSCVFVSGTGSGQGEVGDVGQGDDDGFVSAGKG
jgi:hypothetical protein